MATVLYITAHPLTAEQSFSLSVGSEFVKAYEAANPGDKVVHVDLFNSNIPQIDADVLGAWGKLQSGTAFDQLSATEQAKVSRLGEISDQFVAADKYVFVTPMWNFSYPPVMKAYIDAFCVAGKTFKYTAEGPVGLLGGKKALHIQASGGVYSTGDFGAMFEHGNSHLDVVMKFVGINNLETIFVEGMGAMADQAPAIKEKAIAQAREVARTF
jgi:FMN-dependent NADH-azoreductase